MTAPIPPAKSQRAPSGRPTSLAPQPPVHETVDPRWLLQAALAVVLLAIACAYVTLCAAFWKTQWQLVLHPSRTLEHTPANASLPSEEVHFSPGADGQPQLDGWWIPADIPSAPVALLLHGSEGNMANDLALASALHNTRLHVLLFDYRGFGRSTGDHPSQLTMEQDTDAALAFLRDARHLPLSSVIPVGEGLGASLAVRLASTHPELPAIILSSPRGDFAEEAQQATRSHIVPFTLLFHEHFPLADPLHQLATPKLILSDGRGATSVLAQRAADPKMTVEGLGGNKAALESSLRRFLDIYVQQPPQELRPSIAHR